MHNDEIRPFLVLTHAGKNKEYNKFHISIIRSYAIFLLSCLTVSHAGETGVCPSHMHSVTTEVLEPLSSVFKW